MRVLCLSTRCGAVPISCGLSYNFMMQYTVEKPADSSDIGLVSIYASAKLRVLMLTNRLVV